MAEQFDRRQRQGLARFLAHLEARREVELDSAPPPTESGTVRLMSIHQSKGLEFPMVILPDLAKGFNEMDLREDLIFDEHFGLCPLVKPPFTARRYPSLPFWLARRRQRRELRGEELRLLYVALTRARDSLVLVATVPQKQWSSRWTTPAPVTPHAVAEAKSYADWLGMWFASRPDAAAAQPLASAVWPELAWRWVNDDETFAAATPDPAATSAAAAPDRPGLPEDPLSEADYRRLTGWLEWNYPFAAATRQKAKVSVTELRKAAELAEATEAAPLWPRRLERRPAGKRRGSQLSAAQAGLAHHQFMQRADLGAPLDTAAGVRAEADRLAREGYLTPEERQGLDLAALADFWRSPFGCELREHAASVRRELPFMARFTPAEVAAATGRPAEPGLAGEFLVVQGAADLVVLLAGEIWLVDFKTDAVGPAGPAEKVKTYTPQVRLYAAALEKIFHRPVTRAVLHFLSCGETVSAVSRQDGPPAAGALFGETVPGKLVTGAARP